MSKELSYPRDLTFGHWVTLGGKQRKGDKYFAEVCCTKCGVVKYVAMYHLKDGKSTQCRKCASAIFKGKNNPCLVNIARGTSIVLVQKTEPNRNNSTGYRGVYKQRNRYKVMFTYKRIVYQLHGFETAELAHEAYLKLKAEVTSQDGDIIKLTV